MPATPRRTSTRDHSKERPSVASSTPKRGGRSKSVSKRPSSSKKLAPTASPKQVASYDDPLPSMFPSLEGPLDRLDKALTYPISSLYLGFLEVPLTVIGTWFGIPLTAMALAPLVLAAVESPSCLPIVVASGLFSSAMLLVWFHRLSNGTEESFYAFPHLLLFIVVLVVQVFASLCQSYLPGTVGSPSRVSSLYLCSYLLTQTVVLYLKLKTRRLRPALARPQAYVTLPRLFPAITFVGKTGFMVFESFPSGDSAGSLCFAVLLSRALGGSSWPAVLPLISAFGRIYFFAHHILDVIAGWSIGFFVTALCVKLDQGTEGWPFDRLRHYLLPENGFGIMHVLVVMVFYVDMVQRLVKKYRLTLPKQFVPKHSSAH